MNEQPYAFDWSQDAAPGAEPPGFLEYETRTNVRDLIRLYGFEEARAIVAGILNDEADRRRA